MEKKYYYKVFALTLIFTALASTWYFSQKKPQIMVSTPTIQQNNPTELKGVSLYFNPTQISMPENQEAKIELKLDTALKSIKQAKIIINYDPQFLQLNKQVQNGNMFSNLNIQSLNSQITLTGQELVAGQGTLAKLFFKPLKKGSTILEISSSSLLLGEKSEDNLLQSILNAQITIE